MALLAHPPLAGIGEQRDNLTKVNPLPIVLGGTRQVRKKRQGDQTYWPENSHQSDTQLHLSVLCISVTSRSWIGKAASANDAARPGTDPK
jgi:hypothetical protein